MTPSGKIYLRETGGLVAMTEEPYDAEEILQRLLADYPDLLAGDQIQPSSPRRWLLIKQEAAIPDTDGGGGRWSLDHLFVDQDAIPTLVEVKRSSDTRLRREVVGQMLDYAANIVAYWPADHVRTMFEQRCEAAGLDPQSEISALVAVVSDVAREDAETEVDDFWQRVGDNLVARRLRLVFVADVIPRELQAIIEFLNEGLATSDVLAVEVKQYVGEGRQILVPRVIGWTTAAEDVKRGPVRTLPRPTQWDEASFFNALRKDPGDWAVPVGRALFDWAGEHGLQVWYGQGAKQATMSVGLTGPEGKRHAVFKCHAPGGVMLQFDHLKLLPPFNDPSERTAFRARLGSMDGVSAEQMPDTWPTLRWETLRPEASLRTFLDTYEWAVARIREATS